MDRQHLERTVTLRTPGGRPLMSVRATHAAAAGIAAVLLAPRATAVAAVAGMIKGLRITIDTLPVAGIRPEAA